MPGTTLAPGGGRPVAHEWGSSGALLRAAWQPGHMRRPPGQKPPSRTLVVVEILFQRGALSDQLAALIRAGVAYVEGISEDEVLTRSDDDIMLDAIRTASCDTLRIETANPIDGDVEEISEKGQSVVSGRVVSMRRDAIWAEYAWEGDPELFWF